MSNEKILKHMKARERWYYKRRLNSEAMYAGWMGFASAVDLLEKLYQS